MDVGGLGDKAKRALGSEQGEQRSDQALDKAEQFADEETGDKYDQQTDKAGDLADQRLGQQNGETAPDRAHPAGDQGRRSSRDRANWGSGAGDASPGPARRTFEPLETPVTGPR